jgi:acyl-[acyl-carrier-protein]-phospholipid O-acyltransferase/long-chain-fatty-acid--[acyl-carrier-protein] ligase
MLALLRTRRFGPLFVTQFLGAFNDNLFRTAVLFIVAYDAAAGDVARGAQLASLSAGLFILPFLLFSGLAGALADRRCKAAIARWVKLAEIAFMAAGWAALAAGNLAAALVVVFLMGCHSTIFGPVKYAILPVHVPPAALIAATGLVEAATFVAILVGQVAGGLLPTAIVGPATTMLAAVGWLAARAIPPAPAETDDPMRWNPWASSRAALAGLIGNRRLLVAGLAISWFWALGAVTTSQFVPLTRNVMGGSEGVATLFLALFSIGIAAGSLLVARVSGARISPRACVVAAALMALAATDLWVCVGDVGATPKDVAAFLALPAAWRVLADMALLSLAGGVFSVPLYAVLQTAPAPGTRASAIAANNILNSLLQVAAVLGAGAAAGAGLGIPLVLMLMALLVLPLLPFLGQGHNNS